LLSIALHSLVAGLAGLGHHGIEFLAIESVAGRATRTLSVGCHRWFSNTLLGATPILAAYRTSPFVAKKWGRFADCRHRSILKRP
jgi:hypothetical protein